MAKGGADVIAIVNKSKVGRWRLKAVARRIQPKASRHVQERCRKGEGDVRECGYIDVSSIFEVISATIDFCEGP